MIVDIEIIKVYACGGPYDFEYGWRCGGHWSPRPNLSIGEAQRQAQDVLSRQGVIKDDDSIRWQMPPERVNL